MRYILFLSIAFIVGLFALPAMAKIETSTNVDVETSGEGRASTNVNISTNGETLEVKSESANEETTTEVYHNGEKVDVPENGEVKIEGTTVKTQENAGASTVEVTSTGTAPDVNNESDVDEEEEEESNIETDISIDLPGIHIPDIEIDTDEDNCWLFCDLFERFDEDVAVDRWSGFKSFLENLFSFSF